MVGLVRSLCIRNYSAVEHSQPRAGYLAKSCRHLSRFKHFWQSVCCVAFDTAPNWGPRERFIVCCQLLQLMRVTSSRLVVNENALSPRAVSAVSTVNGLDRLVEC